MSSSKLRTLQICFQLILTTIQWYRYNMCTLQMRELGCREAKQLGQDYTATRHWSCQGSLKECAVCAYELAKRLMWINTLCMRSNRTGWGVNHPGKWGSQCSRNTSHHYDIMIYLPATVKNKKWRFKLHKEASMDTGLIRKVQSNYPNTLEVTVVAKDHWR